MFTFTSRPRNPLTRLAIWKLKRVLATYMPHTLDSQLASRSIQVCISEYAAAYGQE